MLRSSDLFRLVSLDTQISHRGLVESLRSTGIQSKMVLFECEVGSRFPVVCGGSSLYSFGTKK